MNGFMTTREPDEGVPQEAQESVVQGRSANGAPGGALGFTEGDMGMA